MSLLFLRFGEIFVLSYIAGPRYLYIIIESTDSMIVLKAEGLMTGYADIGNS